jgi:filamentous hemagglutinin family protein
MAHRLLLKLVTSVMALAIPIASVANPMGGEVTSGEAGITQDGNTMTVKQTSPVAIIKWQSFNIQAAEKTHFQQPANGVALNHIDPQQGASQIYGALSATGKIILVNAAGIHFQSGSVVNVGSIIVSTADISDEDFLAKKYNFNQHSRQAGVIINEGTITAQENGLVAFLGTGIINNGVIQARLGNITLVAGNKFTLDFNGDQLINFSVDEEAKTAGIDDLDKVLSVGIKNTGQLLADGGVINLTARVATHILDKAIDMEGVAEAHSTLLKNGIIVLSAGPGKLEVSGKLDVSGNKARSLEDNLLRPYPPHKKPAPPMTGGTIEVTGTDIMLTSTAMLDATGSNGGGKIYIGGNYQGTGPLLNASRTTVAAGAILNASALTKGNGGEVVVWSSRDTCFSGRILTLGGTLSGTGGLSEVGSHENISYKTAVLE